MPPTGKSTMQSIELIRLLQDFLIYSLSVSPIIILRIFVEPYHRGFYCSDDSIRYPNLPSTISLPVMAAGGVLISLSTILLVETYRFYKVEPNLRECPLNDPTASIGSHWTIKGVYIGDRLIPPLFARIFAYASIFLFGGALCQTLVDIGKCTLGELRPFFIEACLPDWSQINCSYHRYVTDYVCLTTDRKTLSEARQSFPSAHASFGAYCACFAILYLRKRAAWPLAPTTGRFVRPFVQYLFIVAAFVAGMTRINDNQHHSNDVLGGFIIGVASAYAICYHFEICGVTGAKENWRRKKSYESIKGSDRSDACTVSDKETMSLLHSDKM